MKSKEHNSSKLPKHIKSWYELYKQHIDLSMNEDNLLHIDWIDNCGDHRWSWTLDFIKARCFDEKSAEPFTFDDLMVLQIGIRSVANSDQEVKLLRKINDMREIKIRKGDY